MGWGSGSRLFSEIIESLEEADITHEQRKTVYSVLIEKFEDYDCDTLMECLGVDRAFDEVYRSLYPDEDEEYDDEDLED